MKYLETVLVAMVAIFAPIKAVLITTMVLIVLDFITGVLASRKDGIPITSSGFRRTISKIFVYELALILAFLSETYMLEMLPITKMVSSIVALTELKSIYENLDILQGGDLLKTLITKLGSDNSKS